MDAHSGMHQIWGVLKAIMLAPPGSLQMFLGQNMKWRVSPPCMQACPDNHCPSMIGSGVATGVLGIVAFGTSVSVCPPPFRFWRISLFWLHTMPGAEKHLAIVWGWQ